MVAFRIQFGTSQHLEDIYRNWSNGVPVGLGSLPEGSHGIYFQFPYLFPPTGLVSSRDFRHCKLRAYGDVLSSTPTCFCTPVNVTLARERVPLRLETPLGYLGRGKIKTVNSGTLCSD